MILSNLTGGLGNQMFQYAFGRYLAVKNKTELKIHFTNALFNTQYAYWLDVFNIQAEIATGEDLKKMNIFQNRIINRIFYLVDDRFAVQFNTHIVTQRYPYVFNSNYLSLKNNVYVQGYWADERYFKGSEGILRKEFTLKNKLDSKNRKILKQIQNTESVSIHVRRADYVTNKINIPQFIGLDYYVNAIKKINKIIKNPAFFIFSDDISWCKGNLSPLLDKAYYIDHNQREKSYKDLYLMSICKHNIIANSTFSWWATWLNKHKDKTIITPK